MLAARRLCGEHCRIRFAAQTVADVRRTGSLFSCGQNRVETNKTSRKAVSFPGGFLFMGCSARESGGHVPGPRD